MNKVKLIFILLNVSAFWIVIIMDIWVGSYIVLELLLPQVI